MTTPTGMRVVTTGQIMIGAAIWIVLDIVLGNWAFDYSRNEIIRSVISTAFFAASLIWVSEPVP